MKKIMQLELLCVYVTFVDENGVSRPRSVVSMVSTIDTEHPDERTLQTVQGTRRWARLRTRHRR